MRDLSTSFNLINVRVVIECVIEGLMVRQGRGRGDGGGRGSLLVQGGWGRGFAPLLVDGGRRITVVHRITVGQVFIELWGKDGTFSKFNVTCTLYAVQVLKMNIEHKTSFQLHIMLL